MPRIMAFYAHMPWTSGALWKHLPLVQGALRRRAVFDSREAAFTAYRGRGAFRTWPEAMLADYVGGGFRDRDDGKVELACAPAWEASNYSAQAHDPWRAMGRIRCPARILKAEKGSTAHVGDGAGLMRRHPSIRVETVAGPATSCRWSARTWSGKRSSRWRRSRAPTPPPPTSPTPPAPRR
jgi:hypothetical protein